MRKITKIEKKVRNLVIIMVVIDVILAILEVIILNWHVGSIFLNTLTIIIIEIFIVFYYLYILIRSARNIDLSLFPGTGTEYSPFIIDSESSLPVDPIIYRNKKFNVVLRNLEIDEFLITKSKHIKIENCRFRELTIYKGEDIEVKGCLISKSLFVSTCDKILIESSEIGEIELARNYSLLIQNNHINNVVRRLKEVRKSNNIYRNNKIDDDVSLKLGY